MIHYLGIQSSWSVYSYIYCGEDSMPGRDNPSFTKNCVNGKSAYSWDDLGEYWSAHYILLCDKFFGASMNSVDYLLEISDENPFMQRTIDYWKLTRGHTLFHETYHWEHTVSRPRCRDITYDAASIVTDLAVKQQDKSVINAESYALAASAIYAQRVFHLSKPPKPKDLNKRDTTTDEEVKDTALESGPAWWEKPASTDKSTLPALSDTTFLFGLRTVDPWRSAAD